MNRCKFLIILFFLLASCATSISTRNDTSSDIASIDLPVQSFEEIDSCMNSIRNNPLYYIGLSDRDKLPRLQSWYRKVTSIDRCDKPNLDSLLNQREISDVDYEIERASNRFRRCQGEFEVIENNFRNDVRNLSTWRTQHAPLICFTEQQSKKRVIDMKSARDRLNLMN